jgi:GNAT superfamily N-acetyltransferase
MDDARLMERMLANMRAFHRLAPEGRGRVELPGVVATFCPPVPERSLFNSVVYETEDALVDALDELERIYRDAGIEAWTVWVPGADAKARQALERAGHTLDADPAAMVVELDELALPTETERFEGALAEVLTVNDRSYPFDDAFTRALARMPAEDAHLYVGRTDGRPAAAVMAFDEEGDCGIYLVATIPEARGRGLASRLMRRALADARERGCTTSSLQATKAGEPIYRVLGYRSLGPIEMWERRG